MMHHCCQINPKVLEYGINSQFQTYRPYQLQYVLYSTVNVKAFLYVVQLANAEGGMVMWSLAALWMFYP